MLVRGGSSHDTEDDTEPCASDANTHKDFQHLVAAGRGRDRTQCESKRIDKYTNKYCFAVTQFLGERPKEWCRYTPRQVLDRDSQRKLRPKPTKVVRYWNLKNTETRPDRKTDQQDQRRRDKDRRKDLTDHHGVFVPGFRFTVLAPRPQEHGLCND